MSRTSIFFLTALATAACGTDFHTSSPPDGLHVVHVNANKVSGTFSHNNAALAFTFTYDGASRTAELTALDGTPLLESTLAGEVETSRVLGALTITASPFDASPRIDGDGEALAALAQMPEGQLLAPLHIALASSDVRRDLYASVVVRCPRAWTWWFAACYGATENFQVVPSSTTPALFPAST
jgi:hypothetical protein